MGYTVKWLEPEKLEGPTLDELYKVFLGMGGS